MKSEIYAVTHQMYLYNGIGEPDFVWKTTYVKATSPKNATRKFNTRVRKITKNKIGRVPPFGEGYHAKEASLNDVRLVVVDIE